jgi:hypothetical protein
MVYIDVMRGLNPKRITYVDEQDMSYLFPNVNSRWFIQTHFRAQTKLYLYSHTCTLYRQIRTHAAHITPLVSPTGAHTVPEIGNI